MVTTSVSLPSTNPLTNKEMNVKSLKEKLKYMPDNMEVFLAGGKTDFAYGLLNSAYVKEIVFSESQDDDDSPQATVECLILDEE